jgi:hypothetical protein
MKIRLKSIYAGPSGTHQPGETVEVARESGAALCAGGYGEEIAPDPTGRPKRKPKRKATKGAPETADVKPPETAA